MRIVHSNANFAVILLLRTLIFLLRGVLGPGVFGPGFGILTFGGARGRQKGPNPEEDTEIFGIGV